MKKVVTWASGPIIALFFLWFAFKDVDRDALLEGVKGASIPLLVVCALFGMAHVLVRSIRWKTLLGPAGPGAPFWERFSAVSIGYMASLLPGRVGEVLRPVLLARRTDVRVGTAVSTVAVERLVLDLFAVMSFGAIGLVAPQSLTGLVPNADPEILSALRNVGGVVIAGLCVALVVIHVLGRHRERAEVWLLGKAETLPTFIAKIARAIASLFPGLAGFATVLGTLRLIVETFVVWIVVAVGVHTGIAAAGVELGPLASLFMVPILALGIAVPAPGGTGPYHAAMIYGLVGLFGTPKDLAAVAGLVSHAITWLPMLLLGGLCVLRGGLVKGALEEARGEVTP